jgi:hypothetical protein
MSKKRISLRDEKGLIAESIIVDNFSIEKIPKDWEVEHNYSIWFEDEEQWDYE